jgi:tRNA-(ms[2]io[6]A)-hydroxylase
MLSLRSTTDRHWIDRIEPHINEVLVDHAHCEKKAAGAAMSMIFAYVEHEGIVVPLTEVVQEELLHFTQVLQILKDRGIPLIGQSQSRYGQRLGEQIRKLEPHKFLDRCIVAALIEARSCERFTLLRDHLKDRELANFYDTLLESEARHHALYLKMAETVFNRDQVRQRLLELSAKEAEILALGDPLPRLHS